MGNRLEGKVAIVTGGGSGLGEASSRRFAEQGASVLVADLNADAAAGVAAAINDAGYTASSVATDVTSEDSTFEMAAAAVERYDTIDVIYCNAGIAGVGNAMDLEKQDWDRVISRDADRRVALYEGGFADDGRQREGFDRESGVHRWCHRSRRNIPLRRDDGDGPPRSRGCQKRTRQARCAESLTSKA